MSPVKAVVFDVGKVLVEWDLRHLFAKLIADGQELEWFVTTVVTPEWHFQHDAGRDLDEMVEERCGEYPDHAPLIRAYAARFNESIPGPVPGSLELLAALGAAGVPLFALTNFGDVLWDRFRPTMPQFAVFRDILVSGVEKLAKPDPAIYRLAEARFGFAGPDVLFIDDRDDNVDAAASSCGWQVHHFTGAARLEADLRVRGLI